MCERGKGWSETYRENTHPESSIGEPFSDTATW
jgi:hypothetical protein